MPRDPSIPVVRKTVELDRDDLVWLKETYGNPDLGWLLSLLLKQFRGSHTLTPEAYASIAAAQVKRDIEDDL